MGWRDRDWAKFTDEEWRALIGRRSSRNLPPSHEGASHRTVSTSVPRRRTKRAGGRRALRTIGLLVFCVAATAAILGGMIVTGHVPGANSQPNAATPITLHPVASVPPVVDRTLPPRVTRITGTRLLDYGGSLTLSGHHTPTSGTISVRGRWGSGAWITFAVASASRRSYSFRIPLTHRGVLHLRVVYPDGSSSVGTYQVE
jgi:hypothetical protein